jgi:uncharacterized membrane protein
MEKEATIMKRLNLTKVNHKNIIIWVVTVLLSIAYIVVGHNIASKDLTIMEDGDSYSAKARVLSIEDQIAEENYFDELDSDVSTTTIFSCELLNGERKGEQVLVAQTEDVFATASEKPVAVGDKIIVLNYPSDQYGTEWVFGSYVRFDTVLIVGFAFFVLLLMLGQAKGLSTILSLSFTCMAIFLVFIPSILNAKNVYLSTLITCVFITVMTILITNGWSKKALATILGCLFGVLVAASLSLVLDSALRLTGITDEHSIYLTYLSTKAPINLNAIIFGGIVVGSLGAVMDVAMDIASSLYEISQHVENISFTKLVKSGITIGRDIMGTMSNTLVLAYIGSSLSTVLLLTTYVSSITELMNREMIIVELIQALIGSTAILLTIPLTAIACGMIYVGRHEQAALTKQTEREGVSH